MDSIFDVEAAFFESLSHDEIDAFLSAVEVAAEISDEIDYGHTMKQSAAKKTEGK